MAFQNEILAGEELIRNAFRSADYSEGLSGWRIGRDGAAEFKDLVTRGTFTGDTAQLDHAQIGVYDVEAEFAARPLIRCPIILPFLNNTNENWGIGPNLLATISWTVRANTDYLVHFSGAEIASTTVGDVVYVTYRYAWDGAVPTSASPVLYGGSGILPPSRGASGNAHPAYPTGIANSATDRVITVGLFFIRQAGTGTVIYQWSGNGAIFWVEEVGKDTVRGGTKFQPASSTYTPTRYDYTWFKTSAQSYNQAGDQSSASNANIYAYQGDGSAVGNPGGDHMGEFFFDSATIAAALAGSTIVSSYVWLDNVHCYLNSGINCLIGTHNNTPTPAGIGSTITGRWSLAMAKGGNGWTGDLGPQLGNELKAGTTKGITVGYGGIGVINNYGYFNSCAIRIVYDL